MPKGIAQRSDGEKARILEALGRSATRSEAAQSLGITIGSFSKACEAYGIRPSEHLARSAPPVFQNVGPSAQVPTDAPAWQGYRPRAGWTEPERSGPSAVTAAESRRVLVIPDVHVPYHDRKAWSVALSIAREWNPHRVVVIGDFMDTEAVSRHPKTQPDVIRLAEEYHEANLRLDELQNVTPDASWLYIEGNHENRVAKWCNEFGTMDGLFDVAASLYMVARDDYHRNASTLRGMEWIPLSRQPFVIDGVAYLHGVFENMHHASFHAGQLAPTLGVPEVVYGHMHALQSATSPALPGRPGYRATCCGFLGDATQRVFRAYVKGKPKPWDVGLLLQEVGGGLATNTPVRIVDGRALFGGRVVESRAA